MSADSQPITPERFVAAIKDLPLPGLHSKASELRNSIAHLRFSNEQLMPFSEEGDLDCSEAILENIEVIRRMEERIELLKAEVEGRGMRWVDEEGKQEAGELTQSGNGDDHMQRTITNGESINGQRDESVQRIVETGTSDEEGIHL